MRRYLPILLLIATGIVLAACGRTTPAPALPATTAPTTAPVQPTIAPPTETAAPSPTALPPTATTPPTATSAPTYTAVPPTVTPAPTATSTPIPSLTIKAETLNVRSGPGSDYAIVASSNQSAALTVTGQVNDCTWLRVTTPQGKDGWVIGGVEYVTLNVACASVPAAAVPPTPTSPPATATLAAPTVAPAAPVEPAKAPTVPAEKPTLPSDKGCYLITSYVGDELTATFTAKERQWNLTFKLPPMGEHLLCLDPGRYSYTLDHPKWTGGGEIIAEAGQHYRWPLVGRP